MSKEHMPVTEAASYELAFHVLPTVAEGEVATVFQNLKDIITNAGGTVTSEEAPERFELAYDIVKHLEGRNRKFSSAYFGWVRFTLEPSSLAHVSEAVDSTNELLRHLLIRLTKVEEASEFFFHEALAAQQQVENIDVESDTTAKTEEKKETTKKDEATSDTESDNSEGKTDKVE